MSPSSTGSITARLLVLLAGVALIASACGSDGDAVAEAETETTTTTEADTTTEAETTTTEADRVAALAGSPFEGDAALVAAGEAVYAGNCAGCHGAAGEGSNRGPALLGNAEFRPDPLVQVSQVINGGPNMPAFGGDLDNTQVEQVIAYVRATFVAVDEGAAGGDAELIATGMEVYANNCAGCHGADGEGSDRGPALADLTTTYPEAADHIAVVTAGRDNMPAFGEELTAEQIEAVVAFQRDAFG